MIRQCCLGGLVAGLIATLANAAPATGAASKVLGNLLKQKAQRLFELSDQNRDQVLDREEQADAEQRMEKVFHQLAREQVLAGPKRIPPKVAEPQPVDPERITAAEFTQLVSARAVAFDANLRARRLAKYQTPAAPPVVVVMASNTNNNLNRPYAINSYNSYNWYAGPHQPHRPHLYMPAAQPSPHMAGMPQFPVVQTSIVRDRSPEWNSSGSHHTSPAVSVGHHDSHGGRHHHGK